MHALTSTSMIRWMPLAAFLAFLPVFPEGCAGDGDGGGPLADVSADLQGPPELPSPESLEPPAPEELWPPGPPTPALPAWVASRPPLLELSPWAHALERKGAQEPPLRRFGDLAVGNGTVFSMVGFPAPFHRLHNMIGPGYQRKMWFFSDLWLELVEPDGDVTWWAREWMGRVRGTPVVLTHAEGDRATLTAVDAAPLSGATDDPLRRGILRVVILRNTGSETLEGASLRVRFGKPQEPDGGAVQEAVEDKVRRVAVVSGGPVTADAAGLTLALPALPPGGEHVVVIGCATGRDAGEASAAGEALAAADPGALVLDTVARWQERTDHGLRLRTPDPRVEAYLEAQLLMLLAQETTEGAICPMSNYTQFWIRDSQGPVRFLLALGWFEEARRLLDFLFAGNVLGGEITDVLSADLVPGSPLPPQPDWASLPPGTDHMVAETPSHIPLMHAWYWRASGRLDFLPERLAWMKHALDMQRITDGLLPFSGDETFRAAMAIAFDFPLTQEFWTGFYSAYSSFLWVAGARALVDQCLALELDDEAGWVLERLSGMEEAMEAAFRREDGAWLPYVLEEGLAPAPGLFEDVSLQPLWLGLEDPEDPAARENLATVIAELGGEDGILISPLPETYHGFMELPVTQGIYTGMNPGHYLWALSATRHPAAEAAFRALALHATPTGSSPEYQVLDDFSPLHLMSSATGSEPCDYTARYRPWEGGVNAEALVFFLLGLRPDAPAQELGLAPHLPAGWRWLDAQGLRVGDTVVDLELRRPTAGRWLLRLTHRGGEGIQVRLELPVDGEAVLTLDGEPHPAERVDSGFGTHVLRAAPLDLAPGHSVVLATDPP